MEKSSHFVTKKAITALVLVKLISIFIFFITLLLSYFSWNFGNPSLQQLMSNPTLDAEVVYSQAELYTLRKETSVLMTPVIRVRLNSLPGSPELKLKNFNGEAAWTSKNKAEASVAAFPVGRKIKVIAPFEAGDSCYMYNFPTFQLLHFSFLIFVSFVIVIFNIFIFFPFFTQLLHKNQENRISK
ncbi:MAG: hypothetical protein HUU50_22995 [Candidatus Brocadiae bacterium]|nr:hypothetical protein [Candidatus Brocadiia bacterium]